MAFSAQFNVREFGAVGDGVTNDRTALQKAIDACAAAGGGEVVFPTGKYLTGSIVLGNGVILNVTREAAIVGSTDLSEYKRSLIFAENVSGVGIKGSGTVDGRGTAFWSYNKPYEGPPWKGSAQFEYKALKRPSFIRFFRCTGVRVQDVNLINSPSWTLHLLRCSDVEVSGITILNPLYGPNTDGIDVNSCTDVTIRNCDIKTGDDGIVLKSTEPGHDHPSRNISVSGCRIWTCCNALKIGTETHDHFDNISFRDCYLYSESDNPLEQARSGIAIESVDGARLTNITASNITMSRIKAPIFVRLGHRGGNSPRTQQVEPRVPGKIENVLIENIKAENCSFTSSITGIPGHCVKGITLKNVWLEYEGGGKVAWLMDDVPDEGVIKRYPEATMFGRLPAYGLYCRHVRDLVLDDVKIRSRNQEPRPVLVCDDVEGAQLKKVCPERSDGDCPVIWFRRTRTVSLTHCIAPPDTKTFLLFEGDREQAGSIDMEGNDLRQANQALEVVSPGSFFPVELPLIGEKQAGAVFLPAEDLFLVPPMQVMAEEAVPSGKVIGVPPEGGCGSGSAQCRFSVSVSGTYRIWVRVHAASPENDSFYIGIDGGEMFLSDVARRGEWFWDGVRNRTNDRPDLASQATVTLAAGDHVLRIRNRECNTRIDAITVIKEGLTVTPEALAQTP